MPKFDSNPSEGHNHGYDRSRKVTVLLGFDEHRSHCKNACSPRSPEQSGTTISKREQLQCFDQRIGIFFFSELTRGFAQQTNDFEVIFEIELLRSLETTVLTGDEPEHLNHFSQTLSRKLTETSRTLDDIRELRP